MSRCSWRYSIDAALSTFNALISFNPTVSRSGTSTTVTVQCHDDKMNDKSCLNLDDAPKNVLRFVSASHPRAVETDSDVKDGVAILGVLC